MTGADLLVRGLVDRGVTFVTTLSGNGLNPFYVACKRAGLRLVDFHNEQSAAYAADAAARLTRRLAVCAVSSAGAHVNALAGVMNAWFDGAPLLLLTGASEHSRTDAGKFQDMDQPPVANPFCKYSRLVDRSDRIPFYLSEAIGRAVSGRPGPVHLTIPVDVLEAEAPDLPAWPISVDSTTVRPLASPDPALTAEVAEALGHASRPLIVAGTGAFYANAGDALAALAARLDAPIVVPIWDRGVIRPPNPHFMGVIGAATGGPRLLPDADLVLLVGARVDYRTLYMDRGQLAADATIVRIDADPNELRQGVEPRLAMQADPASALTALLREVEHSRVEPKSAWLAECRRRFVEFHSHCCGPIPQAPPMSGRHLVEALRPFVATDCAFLIDGGNIGQWAHQVLADGYPENWLTCGASGVIGWGIGGAIGANLTRPERPTFLLSGDGSIGFALPELETAVRHRTPFVAVVADDRAWGIVVDGQIRSYGREGTIASRLGPVAFDQVAGGFGALGLRATTPEELARAIRVGVDSGRPTLIQAPLIVGGPGQP